MELNTVQNAILTQCKFWINGARYSKLRPEDIENDLFNYHLQELVKKKYLHKRKDLYFLTEKGKSLVTNIQEEEQQAARNYKVSTYICPVIDGKILLYKRLKHPQYGYTGFISEKMKYGENMKQAAQRGLKEETSLIADLKLIGNLRQIRKNKKGEVIEDGVFYIFFTEKVEGVLREHDKEGEYFWVDVNKVKDIPKLFRPSVEIVLKEITSRLKGNVSWDAKFIYEFEPEPEEY